MGTFRYPALVAHPRGTAAAVEVKFLVDTGAMFTCLPGPTLEALGLDPTWRVPVVLADGRREEWGATEVLMTLDDRTLHTTCLFAPAEALPRLGAVSLEQFALSVNPLTRTLVPAPVPMARTVLDIGSPVGPGPERLIRSAPPARPPSLGLPAPVGRP